MKEQSCLRDFARYTTLNILGMIGLSCYILADTFFIAKALGADGLTALNLAIPIYSFIHGSGLMLGVGGAAKYSIYHAQKAYKEGNLILTNTLCTAACLIVLFVLTGIFLSGNITDLLGANNDVFQMTKTYLQIILLFSPAFILNDIFICFVRNDGSPRLAMSAMLLGSLSNIVLDYVLMFPLHMGILGAVLATGIAPVVSMAILSRHLKQEHHFGLAKQKPSFHVAGSILFLGIPSFITELASGIIILVFNMIILNIRGNVGVAAYGVIANLSLVAISIYTGMGQGMQPLLSRAYGTGSRAHMKQLFGYAVKTTLVLSLIIYALLFCFADPITALFNSENNVQLQTIAREGMKLYFLALPFAGYNIITAMYFTATDQAVPAQIISLSRGILVMIPLAFLLSFLLGLTGVWLTFAAGEGIVSIIALFLYCRFSPRQS